MRHLYNESASSCHRVVSLLRYARLPYARYITDKSNVDRACIIRFLVLLSVITNELIPTFERTNFPCLTRSVR